MIVPHLVAVRHATSDDASAIATVQVAAWRWAYTGHLPQEALDALDTAEREPMWRAAIVDPARTVLVATSEADVVGFACVGPTDDDDADDGTAQLSALYLEERAVGVGVGRSLLERATHEMRLGGSRRASLWVLETNDRARRFYERAGWSWDGTRSTHQVQCSHMPIVRYARDL